MRRAVAFAVVAAAAGALATASCNSPTPPACPGDRVATLQLRGSLVATEGSCAFAPDAGLTVGATLSYTGDGGAALCLSRAEAQPLFGTHAGDHVAVGSGPVPAGVSACACAVDVTETVEGDVLHADGGAVSGFAGELRDVLAPADGGDGSGCHASDAGQSCNVPCEIRWQLVAP